MYDGINNIQKSFEWFKSGGDNKISKMKSEYLEYMNQ